MKKFKKATSIFLSLLIVLAMMPMAAFADGEEATLEGNDQKIVTLADDNGTTGGSTEDSNKDDQTGDNGGDTTVTLTYDANADGDEVTGLLNPASETKKVNESGFASFTIKNYKNMAREGYKILGWSTKQNDTWSENWQIGSLHTFDKDTTLYAIWYKLPDTTEPPEIEVPEGAKLQHISIQPKFSEYVEGKYKSISPGSDNISYEYSYTYAGKEYTGETTNEMDEIFPDYFVQTGNLVMDVWVDETGVKDTVVTLKANSYGLDGYTWYAQEAKRQTPPHVSTSKSNTITIPANANMDYKIPVGDSFMDFPDILVTNYYTKNPGPIEVTERTVDIMVSFVDAKHLPLSVKDIDNDYALTYSYKDERGVTIENTLKRNDPDNPAEVVRIPRSELGIGDNGLWEIVDEDEDVIYEYLSWTITVPVLNSGSYLDIKQSNFNVTRTGPNEKPYVWNGVFGVNVKGEDGCNLGELYVSKDGNPVTPYIYNVYDEEFTVTYTDGVENSVIFPDQVSTVVKGSATPTFNDGENPSRSGYIFTGWSPAVAATVTSDVTYVAQWKKVENPVITYTVTYTDGVDGEEVFADQTTSNLYYGAATPSFRGTPAREGYTFTGWSPAVAETVTGDVRYVAQWSENTNIDDPDTPLGPGPDDPSIDDPDVPLGPGPIIDDPDVPLAPAPAEDADPNQPKTGDETPFALLMGMFLISAGALGAVCIRRKEKTEK